MFSGVVIGYRLNCVVSCMNTPLDAFLTIAQGTNNPSGLLVDFPYQDIVHPTRRDMTMKRVVELARRDATHCGMRVDCRGSAQRVLLAQYGCELYQGYLLARPAPVAALEALVLQRRDDSTMPDTIKANASA